jgi:hypothetical protein
MNAFRTLHERVQGVSVIQILVRVFIDFCVKHIQKHSGSSGGHPGSGIFCGRFGEAAGFSAHPRAFWPFWRHSLKNLSSRTSWFWAGGAKGHCLRAKRRSLFPPSGVSASPRAFRRRHGRNGLVPPFPRNSLTFT